MSRFHQPEVSGNIPDHREDYPKRMTVRFNIFHDARGQQVLFRSPTKDPIAGVGKIRKAGTRPRIETYAWLLFVYVEIVFLHRTNFPS